MSPEQPQFQGPVERKPSLLRNPVSLMGAALAATSLATIAFLFFVNLVSIRPSPYVGVLLFMVTPAFLILGLLLISLGMLLERRRRRKGKPGVIPRFPRIDLNIPAQRHAFAFFVSFALVFGLISAMGSYRTYEFTDSVQFCGQTCHTVMRPEYTTYLQSPHARVECVQCHVGPGAGWYVRSKLSGSYQVYAAIFDKYPRRSQRQLQICGQPSKPASNATGQGSSTGHSSKCSTTTAKTKRTPLVRSAC